MTVADLHAENIARLLAPIAAGLRADGYRLDASVETNQLSIRVVATPEACDECLVPKDVFGGIVASTLRKQGVAMDGIGVLILYPSDQ